ncbi:hypothetical protein HYDPIDRAFT_121714 [Hydnomerulius pinastri MD-312]|nr:hypothetical protein HYDPIDRAFT_121714 [Hydnomerulius pinastri MD-312]
MNTGRAAVTQDKSHSLGESYQFDPRDGWESVSVTNLHYKYRSPEPAHKSVQESTKNSTNALKRSQKPQAKGSGKNNVIQSFTDLFAGLVGMGKPEPVTITWYTGHDLQNPSCWKNTNWAPTDESYVAAVTEDGWATRPKCFKFLELCRPSSNCTFVRVVDTCAGCAKGSKHVDLTQAAFEHLGTLGEGIMTVQMREANEPENW